MKKPNILIVGSLGMDYTFSTRRFPNSGETTIGDDFKIAPGSKGANQAVQVARLGSTTTMFGKLGNDDNGKKMYEIIKSEGINADRVLFDKDKPTQVAGIILEVEEGKDTKNRILIVQGANMAIKKEDVAFLKDEIKNYDLVMLQLEIPMEINEIVAKYAYEANVPCMLNSAPSAPLSDDLLKHITYISPNEHEAKDITGVEIKSDENGLNMDSVKKVLTVLKEKGVKNAMVTLGSYGAALLNDEGFYYSPCIKGIDVKDPTAAGDSFVAAFCVAISSGMNINDALTFSNHVAALTVSEFGAQPSLPKLERVEKFLLSKGINLDLSALKNL